MVQEIQNQNGCKIMTKKEMEKLETAERELARLKLRLEIIRTICPILAIALQIIILVRVF